MEKVLQELILVHFLCVPKPLKGDQNTSGWALLLYICTWSQLPVVDEA